jgi:hypothetical protein
LRRLATLAILLMATACGSGQQAATDASSAADSATATDASSAVDSGADRATVDAGASDGSGSKDSSAPPPDAAPADTGPPDMSCPPLQASGYQITDTTTNLTWSRYQQGQATYADATATCAKSGARLPTESELLAFANTSYSALFTCDPNIPQPWPADGEPMWTTTSAPENPNFFFTVYNIGTTTEHPSADGVPFICVSP